MPGLIDRLLRHKKQPALAPGELAPTWNERATLSMVVTGIVVGAVLLASSAVGYYALRVLYENKLTDTWAIMFLELERNGRVVSEQLQASVPAGSKNPAGYYRVEGPAAWEKLGGFLPADLNFEKIKIAPKQTQQSPYTLTQFGGEDLLLRDVPCPQDGGSGDSSCVMLTKVELDRWMSSAIKKRTAETIYIISREGRLFFTNDTHITETNYMTRMLVQQFVGSPVRQGQTEFAQNGQSYYGFYQEIPSTNLVIFAETRTSTALAPVRALVWRFIIVTLVIMVLATVILQYPLATFLKPVRELVRLSVEISMGNFSAKGRYRGFGEINLLTKTFSEMGDKLIERDTAINKLMEEQKEQVRLEGELAIARSIQQNLLPVGDLPAESGLMSASCYVPATEVAGDWYHHAFNPESRESVFVMADVSGHGAGSSMFTAVIAGLFNEFTSHGSPFPCAKFMAATHRAISDLGHGKWHATMLVVRYSPADSVMEFHNAGHPFPMIIPPNAATPEFLRLRSCPLGIDDGTSVASKVVPFPSGSSFVMYTDGLTFAGTETLGSYGTTRLRQTAASFAKGDVISLVAGIHNDWRRKLGEQQAPDDLCIIAVRAS